MEAYRSVKANNGAAGVDEESLKDFGKDLKMNLYKIWNRMSSGSYFPPPVRTVEIPKADGKLRKLGIPTVGDRVAQMVVKMYLEPRVEPTFHPDSFGYRPQKSAIQAVEVARKRCWKYDWVIDLDIKGFFDNIDHELMMRAVKKHTTEPWILMYIKRWLEVPTQEADGSKTERNKGTPQGGVISPLLANIYLHYSFDDWIQRNYPSNPFERYADDIVVHCRTEDEAIKLREAIRERLQKCKLELHPEKTKIVYCKDSNRTGSGQIEKFDFLGFTFRPRSSMNRYGKLFVNFSPAMSDKAKEKKRDDIKSWLKEVKPTDTLTELAKVANPAVTGWINHYGRFYAAELWSTMNSVDAIIMKWAKKKYEQFKRSKRKVRRWLADTKKRLPTLFKSWLWMRRHDLDRRAV